VPTSPKQVPCQWGSAWLPARHSQSCVSPCFDGRPVSAEQGSHRTSIPWGPWPRRPDSVFLPGNGRGLWGCCAEGSLLWGMIVSIECGEGLVCLQSIAAQQPESTGHRPGTTILAAYRRLQPRATPLARNLLRGGWHANCSRSVGTKIAVARLARSLLDSGWHANCFGC